MKIAAMLLILLSLAVVGYLSTRTSAPLSAPMAQTQTATQTRDDVTLRSMVAGDIVGFVGDHGARTWLGIPFAQPPVSALRWQPPQPPKPWSGIRETLVPAPLCPQLVPNSGSGGPDDRAAVQGSEDCLYLNVFAPANARNLPVMLWIHGGGNSVGTGATYNGSTLATSQRVVVVTINYRLGPLGWFTHPALATGERATDSGNFGNLDIIRALEWTQQNIAVFGGAAANVTIFGESAGATNVLSMVASPLAANLFHRGIVQSGSYRPVSMPEVHRYARDGGHAYSAPEFVNQLLVADGANPTSATVRQDAMSPADLRAYLLNKSTNELFATFDSNNFGMLPTPKLFADGHVLPATSPDTTFSDRANHNSVPMILGTNRDESSLFMFGQPRHVDSESGTPRLRDPAGYLREVKYSSLAWKERGVDRIASHLTAAGNTQVFAYRFDWDEEGVINGIDLSKAFGAAHGVEMAFVFGDFDSGYQPSVFYQASATKQALAESMMAYWSQFAATGDPASGRNTQQSPWRSWGTNNKTMLILDTPADQGIFMTSGRVTVESIKAELAADPDVASTEERCRLYALAFPTAPHFDATEFTRFGDDGCAQYDAQELRGF
jgi:para-nitrobenzyl esterase